VSLKLNKADDARIKDMLVFHRDLAQECQELLASVDSADKSRILHLTRSVAHEFIHVGLMAYQQQCKLSEICTAFEQATAFLTAAFSISEEHDSFQKRDGWPYMSFDTLLNLLPIFGTADCRATVARLAHSAFDFNETYDSVPISELPGVLAFMDVFRHFIHDGFWDEKAARDCEQACLSPTAARIESRDFRLRLSALKAVRDQRSDEWNRAIAEIVRIHKLEATRGEYKLRDDAFICLPALALAQIGRRSGMTCVASSPYLPLQLLDHTR